jgi:hypothetical protein
MHFASASSTVARRREVRQGISQPPILAITRLQQNTSIFEICVAKQRS